MMPGGLELIIIGLICALIVVLFIVMPRWELELIS